MDPPNTKSVQKPPTVAEFLAPAPILPPGKKIADSITTKDSRVRGATKDGKDQPLPGAGHEESMSVGLPPPKPKVPGWQGGSGGGTYRPPRWAPEIAPTDTGLSLTVLKGGVEMNSISLDNRTHCLLGRQQGVVDVLLEHPSISRQHAILQHGSKGLFLFDNGSTHGCMVNKKRIASKEYHRLSVGDVIKFGESTRLYALEGPQELLPAEYESDNLRQLRQEAARKQLAVKIAKVKAGGGGGGGDGGEYGISWGFDEDAVAEDSDGEGEEGMEGEGGEVR